MRGYAKRLLDWAKEFTDLHSRPLLAGVNKVQRDYFEHRDFVDTRERG
jgi:hypothetical protein